MSGYRADLRDVLAYGQRQGYGGYSKYDAMNSPFLRAISLEVPFVQWAIAQAVYRFPVNLRPLLGVRKGVNPKAMGLFALGYLLAAQTDAEKRDAYISEARNILGWLIDNRARGYAGMACGYNYVWPNFRFTAPQNFPNLVVTGNVIIAFLTAYEMLGDSVYLETARSSVDFILNDLNTLIDRPDERAISYIPGSEWIVINNQGLAAVLFAWVARHTGEASLRELARRHIQFVANQQTDDGAWYYAYPPDSSPVTHDNYHTGNVLDWLLYYTRHTGDNTFMAAYRAGLEFYRENLFLDSGAPKFRHDVVKPHDIHSSAQGVITFSRAALHVDPGYLTQAQRILDWALDNMRTPDGGFYYMKTRFGMNRTRLMHWNEGLMAVALGSFLEARRYAEGKA